MLSQHLSLEVVSTEEVAGGLFSIDDNISNGSVLEAPTSPTY